ncbi:MAG: ATP-binding protein [Polyangiaceae bacterium]
MSDPRLEAVLDQLARFASGDLAYRGVPSAADDEIDAIVVGLNMLAEDFMVQQSRSRAAIDDMAELFERAPVMLFTLDILSGTVLSANATMIECHGPAESDVVGTLLRDHVAPSSTEALDDVLALLRAGSDVRGYDMTFRGRKGPYAALLSALVADGTSRRARCTLVDNEERRVLETQLLQAQKLEAIGRLAGGVAHDFNNLLTVITNFTSLARTSLQDGSEAAEDLDAVLEASAKAASLTGQLLAFSRRQVVRPRVLQLNELVERTHRLLGRLLGESIDIALVLEPECWPVLIDAGQFEQILVNLAVNARDAMPGGGKLTIETGNVALDEAYARTHAEVVPGDFAMLAVSDTGQGIEADVLERIFEPFFTTKGDGAGTGLGLATCYGIVRQAGGHIWAYSEVGRGTVFKIYLPRARRAAQAIPEAESHSGPELRGTETILFLEDDDFVRAVGARILAEAGYVVLTASTGEEAKRLFAEQKGGVDLLLTDVLLRHTTGLEVAKALRAEAPALPVVYCSGYTDNSVVHHGVLDPDVDFVAKPFTSKTLLGAIRVALDR